MTVQDLIEFLENVPETTPVILIAGGIKYELSTMTYLKKKGIVHLEDTKYN